MRKRERIGPVWATDSETDSPKSSKLAEILRVTDDKIMRWNVKGHAITMLTDCLGTCVIFFLKHAVYTFLRVYVTMHVLHGVKLFYSARLSIAQCAHSTDNVRFTTSELGRY